MRYPNITRLYKYCPYNENYLNILINRKIWFSNPESFNDPFDCKYKFKTEVDQSEFENYAHKYKPESLEKLKKLTNSDEDAKETRNKIIEGLTHYVNVELKNSGLFCMSRYDNNILMWSHYADAHKGFCIEFERCKDNELGNFDRTRPVKYVSHNYEKVTVLNDKAYDMKFYTKAFEWKYEGEWRLINNKYEESWPLPAKISAIIFGLRMCVHHKEIIKKFLSDLSHVNYRQAEEVPNQYRIKIVDEIGNKENR